MTLLTECSACSIGDHARHTRVVQAVPEGMLGGAICACEGECEKGAGKREMGEKQEPLLRSFDPKCGWIPAKTIPEPRVWKLWRWLGVGDFKRPGSLGTTKAR